MKENLEMLKEGRMKKNKHYIILGLIATMLFASTIYAAPDYVGEYFDGLNPSTHIYGHDERKNTLPKDRIAFSDIDAYVHLFNPDILSNWNNWSNNKSANDVYEDYMNAADNLYASADSSDSDLQSGMAYAQADAMMIQADKSVSDSYVDFLTNYLTEKQLILSTKILDIQYHKSVYDELSARASYEEALRKENSADNALKYGSGTQVELLNTKKNVADAKANVVNSESATKTYKRNLLINCGMAYDANIHIEELDLREGFDINSINLDNDYQHALAHNVQYEIYKRKLNNARTEEVRKEYEILINAAPQKIYNDLETKYSTLLDVLETKYNREVAYNLALSNYSKAKNEYTNGSISEKEYKTTETNVTLALYNLAAVKYDFLEALENYESSVKGYGNC